jgi:hypothetical protein
LAHQANRHAERDRQAQRDGAEEGERRQRRRELWKVERREVIVSLSV